jgi:hypothetical protein
MTDVSELTEILDLIAAKIDALIAENKRVREALEQINSVDYFSVINCINCRDIARAALDGKEN